MIVICFVSFLQFVSCFTTSPIKSLNSWSSSNSDVSNDTKLVLEESGGDSGKLVLWLEDLDGVLIPDIPALVGAAIKEACKL